MKRSPLILSLLIGTGAFFLFLFFQATGIYGGDSGDLVTAAFQFGVPHPPGYPIYTLLGGLLARIPIFTVSWRVAILSSTSHAIVVGMLFLLVYSLTKHAVAAAFASFSLLGNYVFFLYAVTPEVFALLDFFILLIAFLLYRWAESKNTRYLFAASFTFGLSLSHHHMILFLLPAIGYFVWIQWKNKKFVVKSPKSFILRLTALVALGLLPYLYIPLAARGTAMVNWDRPTDLPNFIRLVTRADYGSFQSGVFYGPLIEQRLIQVKAYIRFLVLDLTPVGIALASLGIYYLVRKQKAGALFFLVAIVTLGPVFFFYASFPLVNRFTLGTYERFLLPSYLLVYVLVGCGLAQLTRWLSSIGKRSGMYTARLISVGIVAILFLYPLTTTGMTLWRFWGIASDKTADNLGIDILSSVSNGSILLLGRDTPLFITQYVRYTLGVRSDVVLLHASRMGTKDYRMVVQTVYPQLQIPTTESEPFVTAFVKANRDTYPIYSIKTFPVDEGWFWVPYGLVYRLVPQVELPDAPTLLAINTSLWLRYHDPRAGILRRYNHLMLSDVLDVYATARIELGKTLLRGNVLEEAKKQFDQAVAIGGDTQLSTAHTLIGITELFLKRCEEALASFAKAREVSLVPDRELGLFEAITYRDCSDDPKRAETLFSEYERSKRSEELRLESY